MSTFQFLKDKSDVFLYDDHKSEFNTKTITKKKHSYKNILKNNFDKIIISPGIDINNCKLSKFLKNYKTDIHTDLDVFFAFYKNNCITITGTNGKSTTCQLMYEVLSDQKFNVKLVGNIGNPILSVKNVKKNTIFVIEASSYQLEYSKIFRSKYAAILNISPDHLERHKTIKKYVKAKFKLFKNQSQNHLAFINNDNLFIKREIKSNRLKSKIIKVDTSKRYKFLDKTNNSFFSTETNKENLSFVLEISKKLNLKRNILHHTIQKFKGLKYRQQIIYKKKKLTVINDSKSTSFSSSIGLLKSNQNIYWLLGGIYKKGDKLKLPKKYFNNIKAFIYGKNKRYFHQNLKGKIEYKNFKNLNNALKEIFIILNKKKLTKNTILFSPSAASFDSFKNFEDRGLYFNRLIKKYLNGNK